MKSTHRNYSESSVQTIVKDPDNHLQNFQLHQSLFINSIPTTVSSKADPLPLETPVEREIENQDEEEDDDDIDDEEEEEKELAFQLQRRLNPRKQEDFVALQSELIQWRRREERKIMITCGNAERKRELTKTMLVKETCLLRKIQALKNEVIDNVKADRLERTLLETVQPKTWQTSVGDIIVETPETNRSREMKILHDEVSQAVGKVSIRIDLLQRVKVFLHRMHLGTTLIKDVLVLVNRELEILQRDTAELGNDMLEGMRTRLTNLFTKLVLKTNTFVGKSTAPALLINKTSTQQIVT